VGEAPEQLLEHHPDLQTTQRRAQAEMRSATAQRDVGVRVPGHVELVGSGEDLRIAIARPIEKHEPVALADPAAPQLGVPRCGAPEVCHRGDEAKHLFGCRADQAGVLT
jgi:hypothetical protein